ncbi:uncharacterized protein FOMMEDRAFT_162676 [Fomitiporia mediterranea MF3/22]|uniref:Uncharacterized protein n=1 Tax=Fomitiporia mediterranea (strain MF3/22) TaxID=694068 RepID=R7SG14_FOMME|nr:uncharacterized protein FOMMEDRAFT_162676 [Fomitiporia mediterranea MF3/22]EJC97656.1 hypothetical protein FOMMEDRAFT_162676 [Fomitiporia mediterranea MF3/22]
MAFGAKLEGGSSSAPHRSVIYGYACSVYAYAPYPYTPYTPYTEVAYRIWVLLTQFTPVIIRAYAYPWEILRA